MAALILTIVCGAVGQSFPPLAQAQTFSDPGFTSEVVTTLPPFLPVGVTWASDGRMFIWQRNGVIRIYKNGQLLATPFLDISAYVNGFDDRGMLGFAFTPTSLRTGMCMSAISAKMAAIPTTQAQKLPGSPDLRLIPKPPMSPWPTAKRFC